MKMGKNIESVDEYIRRYPRIVAHIICESLGYATPSKAGKILYDAHRRQENWCEWIYTCYQRNPLIAVQNAIRNRHTHKGYMAEYQLAKAIVDRYNKSNGEVEPLFASWF